MFDANTIRQSESTSEHDAMSNDPYEGLRSPISLEELARAQGVKPVEKMEDLIPDWPEGEWDDEDDFDALRERWRAEEIAIFKRKLADPPSAGMKPDDYEASEREGWAMMVAAWEKQQAETSRKDGKR